jgi:Flp pilus assembly protein TadD
MSAKHPRPEIRLNDALLSAAKSVIAGKPEEAVQICRILVTQHPDDARVHYALGVALAQSGKPSEAIAAYQRALRLNPKFFEVLVNLGALLSGAGRLNEAISALTDAVRLRADFPELYVNLSNALRENWQIDDAIRAGEKALALKPGLTEAHLCIGAALACKGEFDLAISIYRQAIKIRPDFAAAHLNLGLALLVTGNIEQGWPEYEWRQRCPAALPPRKFSQPIWTGEKLDGKTILLHAEQGFGDAIHFVRYVPMVAEKGGKILLECQPVLVQLFRQVAGIERIIPSGAELGRFDLHCPLPSLPFVFKTTFDSIPAKIPYLSADPQIAESWRQRIDRSGKHLEIGLVWAGSAENRNDRNRSIALSKFSALNASDRFRFHSLQIAPPPADAGFAVVDWSSHLKNFADTAGVIANLDLVISVDTSVAHLAGAMGKKAWLLLPFPPDWRWMLDRTDSPWYPTFHLFRQEKPGDWDAVIRRLPLAEL